MAARTRISARPAGCAVAGALDDRTDRRRPGRRRRPAVEVWPSEKRSEWRAGSSSQPIASSTCEGCGTPAEQAEPGRALDAAGVEQHQQRVALAAGEAEVGVAGQPLRRGRRGGARRARSRTTRRTRSSRSAASRVACSAWCLDRRPRPPPRSPAIAGGSRVPLRMSRSCPPPCTSAVTCELAAYDERADAVGAADLVPGQASARRHRRPRSRPARRRAPAPRRCGPGCRAPRAIATTSAIGWMVPTSLLAHITEIRATLSGSRSTAVAERVEVRCGRAGRPGAARPRRPRHRRASAAGRARRGARSRWTGCGRGAGPRRDEPRRCP